MAELAEKSKPKSRTHKAQQKSAKRALAIKARPVIRGTGKQNTADLQKETMHGRNCITEEFGTDCVKQNIPDSAHMIANTTKDVFTLTRNTKGVCYVGKKRRAFCNLLGQTTKGTRPP